MREEGATTEPCSRVTARSTPIIAGSQGHSLRRKLDSQGKGKVQIRQVLYKLKLPQNQHIPEIDYKLAQN